MKIQRVEHNKQTRPLYVFFNDISADLHNKIFNKFQSYVEHGEVYHGKQLKSLNPKIWKYKGRIYKLRVDNGKESARVLFAKATDGNLIIIHAFLKSTRKTPAKDAHQAIAIYQVLDTIGIEVWDETLMNT